MVFVAIVKNSIWANWLILAVILLRLLFKKAPKRVICILWAVVAVRLLLPFSIESPVSLIPQTAVSLQEAVDTTLIHVETVPTVNTDVAALPETAASVSTPKSGASALPAVWGTGVVAMLGYLLFSYLRMRHLVREAVLEKGNIWVCDAVTSPLSWDFSDPEFTCRPGFPKAIGHMCLPMRKPTCAARTISGSPLRFAFWRSTGLTRWRGQRIFWLAGTLNLPMMTRAPGPERTISSRMAFWPGGSTAPRPPQPWGRRSPVTPGPSTAPLSPLST